MGGNHARCALQCSGHEGGQCTLQADAIGLEELESARSGYACSSSAIGAVSGRYALGPRVYEMTGGSAGA